MLHLLFTFLLGTSNLSQYPIFVDSLKPLDYRIERFVDSLAKTQIEYKERDLYFKQLNRETDPQKWENLKTQAMEDQKEIDRLQLVKYDCLHILGLYRHATAVNALQAELRMHLEKAFTEILEKDYRNDKRLSKPILPSRGDNQVYDQQIEYICEIQQNQNNLIQACNYANFIQYTEAKLSGYFKDRDFLNAQARFLKSKKNYYMDLRMVFNSPRAAQIYGNIEAGSPIKLSFINGVYVYLKSNQTVNGVLEPKTGNTIYQFQFLLDKEKIKFISKYDVDKISFLWTTGIEEYPVYDIAILKNMLRCLRQKK